MRELIQAPEGATLVQTDVSDEELRLIKRVEAAKAAEIKRFDAVKAAELVERLGKLNRKQRRTIIARARKQARQAKGQHK